MTPEMQFKQKMKWRLGLRKKLTTFFTCAVAVFWIGVVVFVCTFSCNTATRTAARVVGVCQ